MTGDAHHIEERSLGIRFLGVRGSIPVSGREYAEFGGATMCQEILIGQTAIIVDAGSGIRRLGLDIMGGPRKSCHILLTHLHLDHVIGLTAFAPFFAQGFACTIHGPSDDSHPLRDALRRLFSEPLFPVPLDALASPPLLFGFVPGAGELHVGGHQVRTVMLNHGIGANGYRFDHCGRSIVILTDHEHHGTTPDPSLVTFCRNAELIVYDAMWDEAVDYEQHVGWGHSTWQAGVALLKASGARRLACVHHAPEATDEILRERERALTEASPGSFFARQGQFISID